MRVPQIVRRAVAPVLVAIAASTAGAYAVKQFATIFDDKPPPPKEHFDAVERGKRLQAVMQKRKAERPPEVTPRPPTPRP